MIDVDVLLLFHGVAIVLLTHVILLCGRKKAGADAEVSDRQSTEPVSEPTERSEKAKSERVLDKEQLSVIAICKFCLRDIIINRALQIELEMQECAHL
ncbi:hypothetical protein OSTOST_15972 [Ostertagia ostertagi]